VIDGGSHGTWGPLANNAVIANVVFTVEWKLLRVSCRPTLSITQARSTMEDSHGCCWWYLEDTAKHYCGMRLCKQEPGQWYNYENMKIWFIMKICKQKHYTNTINKKWIKLITSRILSHYYYNANWLQTDWQIESVSQSVSQSVATQMFPTETVPPRVFSIKYPTRGLKRTSYRSTLTLQSENFTLKPLTLQSGNFLQKHPYCTIRELPTEAPYSTIRDWIDFRINPITLRCALSLY